MSQSDTPRPNGDAKPSDGGALPSIDEQEGDPGKGSPGPSLNEPNDPDAPGPDETKIPRESGG